MSRRALRPLLLVAVLSVLWALTQSVEGISLGWLSLAPALLLMLPLLSGRYVGETTLRQLAARRGVPRRRRATAAVPAPRAQRMARPHGGLLLARRIAGRAPPVAVLA